MTLLSNPQRIRTSSAFIAARLALCCALLFLCAVGCSGGKLMQSKSRTGVLVAAHEPETPNPLFVQTDDPEFLWDCVIDVIDNYYTIDVENPPRSYQRLDPNGNSYLYQTEGRLDTKPTIVGGIFEPQRRTAATCKNRWRAYFQTIRSQAVVRVAPCESGFFVYLSVYEELEDVIQPMGSSRIYDGKYTDDLTQISQPNARAFRTKEWIPQGRNAELESNILKELAWRVGIPRSVMHSGVDPNLAP